MQTNATSALVRRQALRGREFERGGRIVTRVHHVNRQRTPAFGRLGGIFRFTLRRRRWRVDPECAGRRLYGSLVMAVL